MNFMLTPGLPLGNKKYPPDKKLASGGRARANFLFIFFCFSWGPKGYHKFIEKYLFENGLGQETLTTQGKRRFHFGLSK